MPRTPLISFTSDFGTREYYVGAVKGAILGACPEARVVDISHDIASHDLLEAAFTLLCAYSTFPQRTIHLVVVDPGVGSDRRAIIAVTENYYFIGPDNGVFSLVCQKEEVNRVVSIEAEHHFRQPVSPVFHGRDIFGPVAGALARGLQVDNFGPAIKDYVRLALPQPKRVGDNQIDGIVLHVDKFGNAITNLSPEGVAEQLGKPSAVRGFVVGEHKIGRHCTYYSQAPEDQVVSLVGSSGFYELAALRKPAARLLGVRRGARVRLVLG